MHMQARHLMPATRVLLPLLGNTCSRMDNPGTLTAQALMQCRLLPVHWPTKARPQATCKRGACTYDGVTQG